MDKTKLKTEIKVYKGITSTDITQDELIDLAIDESIERILAKINDYSETDILDIPKSLTFVVRDVAIKRYNRLNSEGAKADSEEGRSFNWDGYLDEYDTTLRRIALGRRQTGRGIARFF
ncbi:TPA: phage head-tail connector protein [Streptococcus suis]|nr:phage head-tail connector protein [Streptococcus suis]HEM5086004.1 phage head-tail connector protein [Streptococcus suis]